MTKCMSSDMKVWQVECRQIALEVQEALDKWYESMANDQLRENFMQKLLDFQSTVQRHLEEMGKWDKKIVKILRNQLASALTDHPPHLVYQYTKDCVDRILKITDSPLQSNSNPYFVDLL